MELLKIALALHGSLILLVGLLGGVFFAKAITSGKGEVAWRVVHSGGCMAGVMLIAFVPVLPLLVLPVWGLHCFVWSFALGTWLLVIGMVIAAAKDSRGLEEGGSPWNRLVNRLYGIGTVFSFIGAAFLIVGLVLALPEVAAP